jgi:hypothetical protein
MRGQTHPGCIPAHAAGDPLSIATNTSVEDRGALVDWTEVSQTLARLMDEGLDGHEAIHAIGNVLMGMAIGCCLSQCLVHADQRQYA